MGKLRVGRILAAMCAAALVVGCTTPGAQPAAVAQPEAVTFRLISDWTTLDIQKAATNNAWQPAQAFYDKLVEFDNAGNLYPYLATSWTTSPGEATFTLRTDATCADGTPVTADVVVASFQRLFADATAANIVKGRFGGVGPFGVTKIDDTHIKLTTGGQNTVDIVYAAAHPGTGIVCPAGLQPGADFERNSYGSGPYVMQSAEKGNAIVGTLRPEWQWGPRDTTADVLPKTLTLRVVVNDTTAANLLVTGGLDIANLGGSDATRLKADSSFLNFSAESPWAQFFVFNETPGHPGEDPLVRQALASAIDRAAWNAATNGEFGTPASGIIAPGTKCYDASVASLLASHDMNRAGSLLTQAGWALGSDGKRSKGGQPLNIVLASPTSQNSGPEYMAEQWRKLGANVTLNMKQQVDWVADFVGGNFDATPVPVGDANNAPIGNLSNFVGNPPPTGRNLTRTINPEIQNAFVAATRALEADRCAALGRLQKVMVEKFDFVPLANYQTQWFTRGLTIAPSSTLAFDFNTIRASQ